MDRVKEGKGKTCHFPSLPTTSKFRGEARSMEKKAIPPTTHLDSLLSLDHHSYSNTTVTGLEVSRVQLPRYSVRESSGFCSAFRKTCLKLIRVSHNIPCEGHAPLWNRCRPLPSEVRSTFACADRTHVKAQSCSGLSWHVCIIVVFQTQSGR